MSPMWNGIIIGAAGGFAASIAFSLCQWVIKISREFWDKNQIYKWLRTNTKKNAGYEFRSTRAIASNTNLTLERVRDLCHRDKRIHLSTGEKDELWSIHAKEPKSIYEERGLLEL